MDPSEIAVERSSFPRDFIFGATTSAYQVVKADGKGNNSIADGTNGSVGFKEDAALMKKVGLNSFKFSISWSLILPGGKLCGGKNEDGIKYYNDLIDALLEQGIEPCVTIFHWDVPQCLENEYGGFLDRQIVEHFCEFADICFWEFGDRVKHWITLNEPWAFTYYRYVRGNSPRHLSKPHATSADETSTEQQTTSMEQLIRSSILHTRSAMTIPQFTYSGVPIRELVALAHNLPQLVSSEGDPIKELVAKAQNFPSRDPGSDPYTVADPGSDPYTVAHNLILAHAHAVNIYRKRYQERQGGKIGMANVSTWFYPLRQHTPEDVEAASRAVDFMLGWFVAPVITGDYPRSMRNNIRRRLPKFNPDEVALVKGSCDFLGINYYTTYYAENIRGRTPQPHYDNDLHVQYHTHRDGKPIGQRAGTLWLYSVPEGIYHLLLNIKKRYNNPENIIIENGLDEVNTEDTTISKAHIDETRIKYHRDHLAYLKKAIDQGVCVKGYFIWSLLDNLEWAHGYNVRSGIFYVEFLNGCLTKFPKRSAMWWRNFLNKPWKVQNIKA